MLISSTFLGSSWNRFSHLNAELRLAELSRWWRRGFEVFAVVFNLVSTPIVCSFSSHHSELILTVFVVHFRPTEDSNSIGRRPIETIVSFVIDIVFFDFVTTVLPPQCVSDLSNFNWSYPELIQVRLIIVPSKLLSRILTSLFPLCL